MDKIDKSLNEHVDKVGVDHIEVMPIVEIVHLKDGTHQHRPHIHYKHKIAMFITMQAPDEFLPRKLNLNFCPGCHLTWWEELPQ